MQVGITTQEFRTEALGHSQHVVDDQDLTISRSTANTYHWNGEFFDQTLRERCGDFLNDTSTTPGLFEQMGVVHQLRSLSLLTRTQTETTKDIDALRCQS